MNVVDLICTRCGEHSTSDQAHTCPPKRHEQFALEHLGEARSHLLMATLTNPCNDPVLSLMRLDEVLAYARAAGMHGIRT